MPQLSVLAQKDINHTVPPRLVMKGGASRDKKGVKAPAVMIVAKDSKGNKENGASRNKATSKEAKAERMRKLLEALEALKNEPEDDSSDTEDTALWNDTKLTNGETDLEGMGDGMSSGEDKCEGGADTLAEVHRHAGSRLNSYERQREANIAKNQAKLKELGLDNASVVHPKKGGQAPKATTNKNSMSTKGVEPHSVRSSTRVRAKRTPNGKPGGLSEDEKKEVRFTNLEEEIEYYIKLPLRQLANIDETDIPWKSERVARRWQVAREEYGDREASDATFEGSKDEGSDDSAESGDESDGDPNTPMPDISKHIPKDGGLIPTPRGQAGSKYSLQVQIGLVSGLPAKNIIRGQEYSGVRATVRTICIQADFPWEKIWSNVDLGTIKDIFVECDQRVPVLKHFENHWATKEIIKSWTKGKRTRARRAGKLARNPTFEHATENLKKRDPTASRRKKAFDYPEKKRKAPEVSEGANKRARTEGAGDMSVEETA